MIKSLKHIVLLFFSLVVLASCGSSKSTAIEIHQQKDTIRETVHDTVFSIEKDSSSYRALLECQNGKVVIKEVTQAELGRSLKSPKVRVECNILKVDCEAREQQLFAQWKSTYESSYTRDVPIPIEVNKISWWQKTQIILFRIFAVVTLFLAVWVYLKSKI